MCNHRLHAAGEIIDRDIHDRVRVTILAGGVFRVRDLSRIGREVGQKFELAVVRELEESRAIEVNDSNLKDRTRSWHRCSIDSLHEDDLRGGDNRRYGDGG